MKSLPMAVLIGALLALRIPCGAATPTLTTLYSFPGSQGAFPEASLVLSNGALYGTTYAGGLGWGTVFRLSPPTPPATNWNLTQLYAFTGGGDGANPRAGVIFSSKGVIYGTTEQGGANGYGTVFSLTPAGGGIWTPAVVHSFTGAPSGCGTTGTCDGAYPETGLTLSAKSGLLYGTTYGGGAAGNGTVFSLTPAAGGTWTEKVLYSFAVAPDGANPLGPLTLSAKGVLYGTTYGGGATGWGTVFQLTQAAGVWSYAPVYSFNGAPSGANGGTACTTSSTPPCDGGAPAGNLLLNATTGVLTGTTTLGGDPTGCPQGGYVEGCGTIFQLTPVGTTWTESLIYTFGPPQDAMLPSYNLAAPPSGNPLFGTAFSGASSSFACFPESYTGCGMAYVLRAPVPPSISWTFNTLAVFGGDNGGGPNGVILSPAGGLLYGTTYDGGLSGGYGTVFQITY